jgi:hypothetical protein
MRPSLHARSAYHYTLHLWIFLSSLLDFGSSWSGMLDMLSLPHPIDQLTTPSDRRREILTRQQCLQHQLDGLLIPLVTLVRN